MAKAMGVMLIFLVPAYNEGKNIATLLENTRNFAESRKYGYKIVVINDGSTDGTVNVLKEYQKKMPLVILDQEVNKGVGEAFKRGFKYVSENADDNDIIISKEADNTSDLSILSEMIKKINAGYDLVLASCYMPGGKVEGTNIYRRTLSVGANFLLRKFGNLNGIYTFSSFYRAYKTSLIKKAYNFYGDNLINEKGFSCMVELLLKFSRLNIKIAEVPMVLRGNLRKGKSKMKILDTMASYLKLITKNALNK